MFRNKVALIVGAGASHELGFPLGSELKRELQQVLDIKFRHGQEQVSGDFHVTEALRAIVRDQGHHDINPHLHACWAIRDAMPTTGSIDSFLETHINNGNIVTVAKIGIAQAILTAENGSPIVRSRDSGKVELGFTENTWYAELFKLLAGSVQDPATIFQNLVVVSFNYDRSLEHYFCHALMRRFLISEAEAERIMKSLEIYHPYGVVGYLPWEAKASKIPYGGNGHFSDLISAISELRTFSEGVEEGYVDTVRKKLAEARTILVIGLGYAAINMNLLNLGPELNAKTVYATALGIDPSEISVLQNLIGGTLAAHAGRVNVHIGCSSKDLFQRCQIAFGSL